MRGQLGAREREGAHLPRRPCRLVVRILLLHRSVYLSYCETTLGTAEDRASQDDGEGMLWSAVGVGKTGEGVWAVLVWFVWTHDNVCLGIIVGLGRSTLVSHGVGEGRRGASVLDVLHPA